MRIAVVASGDLADDDGRWLEGAAMVFAADGGAVCLERRGIVPDRVVGDLDSVTEDLRNRLTAAGVAIERHPADKDASDTELAVEAALAAGATEVVVLGATGGRRLDHELANVLLLTDPGLGDRDVRIVHGPTMVRALRPGSGITLDGAVGDLVTLLPVGGDAAGITTTGLRWPLERGTLRMGRSRGVSNVILESPASVRVDRGTLLVVEHRTQGEPIP